MVTAQYLRLAQRITLTHVEITGSVEEEVHLGDSGVRHVLLLTIDSATAERVVVHIAYRLNQHTAATARRIIDRLAGLRIKDTDQQTYHAARRVKLARFLLALIGKLLEQYLIGITHKVCGIIVIAEFARREMLNQVAYLGIVKDGLVHPVACAEDAEHAVQRLRVGEFDLAHRAHDGTTEVLRTVADVAPMATVRNDKAMLLGESGIFLVSTTLLQRDSRFLIIHITQPLEIQKRCDVVLEILMTHRPAYNVARLVQEVKLYNSCAVDMFVSLAINLLNKFVSDIIHFISGRK